MGAGDTFEPEVVFDAEAGDVPRFLIESETARQSANEDVRHLAFHLDSLSLGTDG